MGYEQSNTARLLFIHTPSIPIAPASTSAGVDPSLLAGSGHLLKRLAHLIGRCRDPRAAAGLSLRGRPLDHDKIDRAARLFIVEHADGQPPGPPREGVEIGAALIKQGAIRAVIMAVDDVEFAEPPGESLRI